MQEGAAGLEAGGEWEDVWRHHCSPGLSASKRQATGSPIPAFKFLSQMVEDGVKGEGPRGEVEAEGSGWLPCSSCPGSGWVLWAHLPHPKEDPKIAASRLPQNNSETSPS